jgi:hypothetical protein
MKTKLTPERKAIRDAQTNKWYMGDRGGAISYPYCIKRYLSKELTDKVAAEIQNQIDKWTKILDTVPASKRCDKSYGGMWHNDLQPQDSIDDAETAIPTEILGHRLYVKVLETYRKGNGQYGVRVMDKPFATFGYYVNSYLINPNNWHRNKRLNFELKFDEEKGLYYVNEYRRVETEPIEITRRNWPRTAMRKKFIAKVTEFEDSLLNSGITINKLCEINNVSGKPGLENCFIDCTGPEIQA